MINSHINNLCVLFFLSLGLNFLFLYFHNPNYYYTITQLHGQIGYNLNNYNSLKINPELTKYMDKKRESSGRLIDFDEVSPAEFGPPSEPFIINDTVGYGMILGTLWKITGSFKFIDVQILQIFIFSILMMLLYQILYLLFGSSQTAFLCCVAQLFFFPLVAMNVQPVRDVWAYYAIVILLYGIIPFLFVKISWRRLIFCTAGFSICQYIRPSVFFALITIFFVLICYGFFYRSQIKLISKMVLVSILVNLLCFWAPFIIYNKVSYDRYFVGPVGQDMLEGLGEFSNPWGYKLCDVWFVNYISQKYGLVSGTPEFDESAQKEFADVYKDNRSVFYLNIFKRIPDLILPGLPWIFYTNSPYQGTCGLYEKVKIAFSSVNLFLDFIMRHLYIRLFLLLGYIGLAIALRDKRYFICCLFMVGVVGGGLGKLPSHIEYRYIVPYYFAFSIFVGYLLNFLILYFKKMQRYNNRGQIFVSGN